MASHIPGTITWGNFMQPFNSVLSWLQYVFLSIWSNINHPCVYMFGACIKFPCLNNLFYKNINFVSIAENLRILSLGRNNIKNLNGLVRNISCSLIL